MPEIIKLESEKCTVRPQFGGRVLLKEDDVFKHNAWDNVTWDAGQVEAAAAAVANNSRVIFSSEQLQQLEAGASQAWDAFYACHNNRFFKNRNWLLTEFPELVPHLLDHSINQVTEASRLTAAGTSAVTVAKASALSTAEASIVTVAEASTVAVAEASTVAATETSTLTAVEERTGAVEPPVNTTNEINDVAAEQYVDSTVLFVGQKASFRVFEIGCGVGNTIFPLLEVNDNPGLFIYGGDFSSTAIDIIRENEKYDPERCNVFVLDATAEPWSVPFPPASLDVITCIYVLSAINPNKHSWVVSQAARFLRPGGLLLFRDYGRYDLAQLRIKPGRCLANNRYLRGDGTASYFFTQEEIRELLTGAGLEEVQLLEDRRLQVNRGRQVTMYRVWLQAKYRKPCHPQHSQPASAHASVTCRDAGK